MKRSVLILVALTVLLSLVTIGDGLCQLNGPFVVVSNYKHNPIPVAGNKLLFHILLFSNDFSPLNGVKKITAENIDPTSDPNVYVFPLTPYTHGLRCDWIALGDFNNQQGVYKITIERTSSDIVLYTAFLDPSGLVPYPTPENLRVSFEGGIGSPTFSFDPVPGFTADGTRKFYRIRIYDEDYTRVIYDVQWLTSPQATFPEGRCPALGCMPSTGEDLIPGERYIFRAEVIEGLQSVGYNFNAASSFVTFRVPKK